MTDLPMPETRPPGVGRASALLASGTIVSRVLGFVSAVVLAQTLTTRGAGANTFALANQLPNNIYAIVAGGLLSAVLVPQIVRAGLHSDGGATFVNRIVTLGAVVFVAVAALATVCAPLLVHLYAQQASGSTGGYTEAELGLATAFAYWCLPQILFYALYSLVGEVLNARKVFGPFTWAPAFNNLVAIAGLLAFNGLFGSRAVTDVATWTPDMIALIAGSASLGVAVQAGLLFFFWRKAGLRYRPEFRWRGVGLGRVGKVAGWTFGMLLVTQLAGIVQSQVATIAGSANASVFILQKSWLVFMLPHSIVTVSIATAYFTRMSAHARDGDFGSLKRDLSSSLRTIGLIMVFAAIGLMVLAYPFAAVFTKDGDLVAMAAMGNILLAFLAGLVPFSVLFVVQRTFYALEDTRTPFFLQLGQAVVFVVGAVFAANLPAPWIAFGIAAVTTIAGSLQALAAIVVLRTRIGPLDGRHLVRSYGGYLIAGLVTAAVGLGLDAGLGAFTGGFAVHNAITAVVSMVVIGGAMLLAYLLALAALRSTDLRALVLPLRERFRHRA